MTSGAARRPFQLTSTPTRVLLIGAQVLALIAFLLALEFLRRTTGGTLFLFSMFAPVASLVAAVCVLGVAGYRFLKRHSLFEIEEVEAGQVIFKQGEEGDCAYFIQSGEVDVVREEAGAERVVSTLSKGQYFGEMALISDAPRNATVRAITAARVAVLGKENFLTMLRVMPHTEEDIMKTVNERAMEIAEK
jgi:CRP-like cAMP-binding protein